MQPEVIPVNDSARPSPRGESTTDLDASNQSDLPRLEEPSMLDVHPPHQAIHGWRDFFIHIATIVVGLLIAVALEQTVEQLHQRYELAETREALEQEQLANEPLWAANERDWRRTYVELKNNLLVLKYLRQHPGASQSELPGELQWTQRPFLWKRAAWNAAQQKGVVQRMRLEEGNAFVEYYSQMAGMLQQSLDTWNAINEAHQFDLMDSDPTHLSTAQLDRVIERTTAALAKHVTYGYSFGLFAYEFPQHPHSITWETIDQLRPSSSDIDPVGLAAAHAATKARLKAANAGPHQNTIDPAAFR